MVFSWARRFGALLVGMRGRPASLVAAVADVWNCCASCVSCLQAPAREGSEPLWAFVIQAPIPENPFRPPTTAACIWHPSFWRQFRPPKEGNHEVG
jgi:hypothetical protein